MEKRKKKIAILFGGCSSEYEVSLQSAAAVIRNIDTAKYEPVLIGLDRECGAWHLFRGTADEVEQDEWKASCIQVFPSTDKNIHGVVYIENDKMNAISFDAALPVLHGKNGEDGTVQGILELMGVPVIGCGVLSSALCMDKDMAHKTVEAAGIKVAKSALIRKSEAESDENIRMIASSIGYPLFVKPDRAGSSFGITKVASEGELMAAVEKAFEHDSLVVLEQFIPGFEVGCAVLGTEELAVGEVDEIELSDGFFDYTEKYTLKTSKIHVPARITTEKAEEIKSAARIIYKALACECFARVDMFLTPDGEIYFNEVNTIPGFTAHSRYPSMMKAAGITFPEIIDRLLAMPFADGSDDRSAIPSDIQERM